MNRKNFASLFFVIINIIFLFSCSQKLHNTKEGTSDLVIYPSPPDTARIQYLTSFSGSINITGKRSTFAQFLLGDEIDKPITKPYGIAVHSGRIYICDTYIHGLEIIDMNKNTFEYFIPTGKGVIKMPINCFVDENGLLYVADGDRKQIVVYNEKGEYVNSFGEAENFKPTDIFATGDKVWVTNITDHKIHVYGKDGLNKHLFSFPESEAGNDDYLFSPTNLFVTNDKVYVSDFGDFKIKVYAQDGKFIESIGTYGQSIGQMARPKGIALDKELNLYVVDAGFENTQIFNKEGKLLMFFGGNYKGPGDMWLPAKVIIDYDNLKYFQKFVDPSFELKYLIFVTNQYGPDKINVYGRVDPAKNSSIDSKQKKKFRKGQPMFD